ncbi:hypothetical protein FD723_40755 (plasmid) [Nostoc sp. C052]|uniref:hypothetical protein n=1 Tax=Nostoc sp. C052 TaxID=2576902 RepID=UPI0015C35B10|nr:hypothetical protein [Nostoc sp. C052]QLE46546.1 hypothetical protein FD723_40755 [Nostoc sp. C052]
MPILPRENALEFCRLIKSYEMEITIEQVINDEKQGTRREYSGILARHLGLRRNYIEQQWGLGISFPKAPSKYQIMMGLILFYFRNHPESDLNPHPHPQT